MIKKQENIPQYVYTGYVEVYLLRYGWGAFTKIRSIVLVARFGKWPHKGLHSDPIETPEPSFKSRSGFLTHVDSVDVTQRTCQLSKNRFTFCTLGFAKSFQITNDLQKHQKIYFI